MAYMRYSIYAVACKNYTKKQKKIHIDSQSGVNSA